MKNTLKNACVATFVAAGSLVAGVPGAAAQDQGQAQEAVPAPAQREASSKISLTFSGFSHHFGRTTYRDEEGRKHFNNFSLGAGIEREFPHFHFGAGAYWNSLREISTTAFIGAETSRNRIFGVGGEIGLVTGYRTAFPVVPGALAYAFIGKPGVFYVKVGVLPVHHPLVTVAARIPLNKLHP